MPSALINGLATYYEEHGSGPAMLLSHHDASSARVWSPFIPAFAASFRVIVYDRRGHGRSASPEPYTPYTIDDLADDIEQLCAHLGIDRLTLMGYSGGSLAALEFALRHVERLDGLIIVEPNAFGIRFETPFPADEHTTVELVERAMEEVFSEGLEAALRTWLSSVYPTKVEKIMNGPGRDDLLSVNPKVLHNLLQAGLGYRVSESRLRTLRTPTLLLGGEQSHPAFKRIIRQFDAWMPNVRTVWVPGADHSVVLQRPKVFRNAVQEFLGSLRSGKRSA